MYQKTSYSPDVVSSSSPLLVPLRNKFKHHDAKEISGWRNTKNNKNEEIKITSSKPYKVKNKRDFYSPLSYAIEERIPFILPSRVINKRSTSKKKLERVLSLKQLRKNQQQIRDSKVNKISISLMVEERENSVDADEDRMAALFSHRSLENLKNADDKSSAKTYGENATNFDNQSKRTNKTISEQKYAPRIKVPLTPNNLKEKNYELLNIQEFEMKSMKKALSKPSSPLKLPVILHTPSGEVGIHNPQSINAFALENSKITDNIKAHNKLILAKGNKIVLTKENKGKNKASKTKEVFVSVSEDSNNKSELKKEEDNITSIDQLSKGNKNMKKTIELESNNCIQKSDIDKKYENSEKKIGEKTKWHKRTNIICNNF